MQTTQHTGRQHHACQTAFCVAVGVGRHGPHQRAARRIRRDRPAGPCGRGSCPAPWQCHTPRRCSSTHTQVAPWPGPSGAGLWGTPEGSREPPPAHAGGRAGPPAPPAAAQGSIDAGRGHAAAAAGSRAGACPPCAAVDLWRGVGLLWSHRIAKSLAKPLVFTNRSWWSCWSGCCLCEPVSCDE